MTKTKKYEVKKWTDWHNVISSSTDNFYDIYGLYPNILIANNHTYSQIYFMINIIPNAKKSVFHIDDQTQEHIPVHDDEQIEINGYEAENYALTFAVDNEIADKSFTLMFDDNPDWDDDNSDEPDTPLTEPENVDRLTVFV